MPKIQGPRKCLTLSGACEVSPSTISRELRRNRGQRSYRPRQAHQHALTRRRQKAQVTKMTPEIVEQIEADLRNEKGVTRFRWGKFLLAEG